MVPEVEVSLALVAAMSGIENAQAKPATVKAEAIFLFMGKPLYGEGGD
jgi:hypothetical protein